MHWLKHRITRKLLKIDRYMLRGVWQALNCLSIHATYCVSQGRLQGKQKCGLRYVKIAIFVLTHWFKHRITQKLLKIDRYMLRGVRQTSNCLSIHATYCVIIAGASPWETKMWAAVRENVNFCTCGSNNWETVEDRWVHAVRQFVSIEFSFHPYNI